MEQNNNKKRELKDLTPEELKEHNAKVKKAEALQAKLKELNEYEATKNHQSQYLQGLEINQEHLMPFIVIQLQHECNKRNKDIQQIRAKMKNNTNYAKKILDKAIARFQESLKCQTEEK